MDNETKREVIENDSMIQRGYAEYTKLDAKADERADKLCTEIISNMIKETEEGSGERFGMSLAILTVSKVLTRLASYLYDDHDKFNEDIQKARTCIPTDIIPALLDPEPCNECENCMKGEKDECLNPLIRGEHTTSKFLPIVANMLLEYDMLNKFLYMFTHPDEMPENEIVIPEKDASSENIQA